MAGPQPWRCMDCFIKGFLEIGNCELADGTIFERSGYCCTSCWANVGSSLTAHFLQASRTAVKDSLPCVSHAWVLYSKGFHCLKETKGRAVEVGTGPGNSLRSGAALQQVQLRNHSDFLRHLKCGETTCTKDTRKQIFYSLNFIWLNLDSYRFDWSLITDFQY